jgi:hypothetical protein
MLSKETKSKVIFAIAITLIFVLFRMGLFVKFLDIILCADGNLTSEGNITILGNITISFFFFLITLLAAIYLL